ncbi:4-hydroxy-3-methylbut-2-en-1-yl diphosphate synthase [Syntrophobotulus glycolicus DSM 8271]|uniref:4-hydroxy-3-methylbut-2-en-1-yl diphosphate synthase (flavodoxin) n=1 Tax=Syntrophobotulus glycolicus (strain DSM 8271 / FlGlyR) TaxID=645991 RepID=F0SU97_SYNGF|nr:flavodoxin-dependent (E)-4-hydroxy-3-methylbut-2-enyl-diphosphate synthase [Syntrophobotulus glycolicus]ADY56547.1 4-hydroxy-3-methylbut-2-en-1-yl diphosphate synthase [Syntrophobotulus glycolicus DSM 8271]
MQRRKSTEVRVGHVVIGAGNPIIVQSMTNTDTRNVKETLKQITRLAEAGCQIVRVAVPDQGAAAALKTICGQSRLPVIADIHFDYKLALEAVENGVQGLRINPGNIGEKWKIREVIKAVQEKGLPIRIGVNAGSLEKDLLESHGGPTAVGLVESALRHVRILEEEGYDHLKISLKASSVPLMLDAYRQIAGLVPYSLHLGVTEAGTVRSGVVKSAVGIGTLLAEGIGDTIRVSLTGDPAAEIPIALDILQVLGLRDKGTELISCPTCGRTQVNIERMAEQVEEKLSKLPPLKKKLSVAVMGCIVNGPGEAREADIGIAGGKGSGLLFQKGEIIARLPEKELLPALFARIDEFVKDYSQKGLEKE